MTTFFFHSEKWAALESPGYRVFLLCIRQQNQQLLSRFMQLESLPDLYQPPSHDSREARDRNISKGNLRLRNKAIKEQSYTNRRQVNKLFH